MLIGSFALGALVVFLYLAGRDRDAPPQSSSTTPPEQPTQSPAEPGETTPADPPGTPNAADEPADSTSAAMQEAESDTPLSPLEALEMAGLGAQTKSPETLLADIHAAFEKRDFEALGNLIGAKALTPEARARLNAMAEAGMPQLREHGPVREVGEMELNRRNRWALQFDDAGLGRDQIFFDLKKNADGTWQVESLTFPPRPEEEVPMATLTDPLGIADAFIQAALHQEFEKARRFVDPGSVTDPKIAGLCILFEEGKYRIRDKKPLRAMTGGEDADHAGFLAHVVTADGSETAQFSLRLEKSSEGLPWRVVELNLERLLSDYARRVAGGDVYYTPLIQNPEGGDTLVLYFDFDQAKLSPRTQRQLRIVVEALRLDDTKKLTISGHTDALGTKSYNQELSAQRAAIVKQFIVDAGVDKSQIVTVAAGQSQPRRPNFTPSGDDDPSGRRANRRTEIYLDF